jgi:hypothetical protein
MTAARLRRTSPSLLLALALACGGPHPGATTEAAGASDSGTTSTTGGVTTEAGDTTGIEPTASTTTTTTTTGDPTDGLDPTTGDATTSTTAWTSTSAADTTTTDESTTDPDTTTGTTGTTGDPGGLGVISGDCGLIDAMELTSPQPFVFSGAIDFGLDGFDYDQLTPGGQQLHDEGNLNASSLHSEIVAYEVLARCEAAALLKTETTIVYNNPMGKKTDFIAEIDGLKVGVSVVRAVGFPKDGPYTVAQAEAILTDKLSDIPKSSANVAPEDAWVKQILSVVAYGPMHRDSLLLAYEGLDPALKGDTLLVITVTDGDDAFIYN